MTTKLLAPAADHCGVARDWGTAWATMQTKNASALFCPGVWRKAHDRFCVQVHLLTRISARGVAARGGDNGSVSPAVYVN